MVRGVRYQCVREGRLSEYRELGARGGFVDGYVKEVKFVACSSSSVNVRLGCMELKSLSMDFMSVCVES